jgi:hypothetical protein
MYKKILPIAIAVLVATACNNNSENKETHATDTANHEGHDHGTTPNTAAIPELPDIPEGAKVYFKNLKEGQTVTSPFKVEMGVDKMSLDTANGIVKAASGHHHILIGLDSVTTGTVVPKDSVHLHFGNAQSEAEVKLAPGKHKLTLQFADALHRSYGPKLTSSVTINVKQ